MTARVLARLAVVAAAVVALAWLVVMERNTRLQVSADGATRAGRVADARADLLAARLWNPDSNPDVVRGLLYLGTHERPRAIATLEDVLRREPDNLTAWTDLVLVARGHDRAAVRRAYRAVARLDPIDARRLRG